MAVIARTIRQEEMKDTPIVKEEIKLFLFTGDMILYLENLKELTARLLELMKEFIKVARYKINKQNDLYFHTLTMSNLKMKVKE